MLGAIVLAGGRSRRMGSDKALLAKDGRRLLDVVLQACEGLPIVVVAPPGLELPPAVRRTLEDPPFGGPAAGIMAGLAALPHECTEVIVLACDLPGAVAAVDLLRATECPVQGVVLRDESGRRQLLAGRYHRDALDLCRMRHGKARDLSVRALVAELDLAEVDAPSQVTADIDDRDAARRWGYH